MEERIPESVLRERLDVAHQQVSVGGRYRHYKGNEYTVLAIALLEASNEVAVIYQAEYGERLSFIRPLQDWLSEITYNGQRQSRFTAV